MVADSGNSEPRRPCLPGLTLELRRRSLSRRSVLTAPSGEEITLTSAEVGGVTVEDAGRSERTRRCEDAGPCVILAG
jgi:hypothetical protein